MVDLLQVHQAHPNHLPVFSRWLLVLKVFLVGQRLARPAAARETMEAFCATFSFSSSSGGLYGLNIQFYRIIVEPLLPSERAITT